MLSHCPVCLPPLASRADPCSHEPNHTNPTTVCPSPPAWTCQKPLPRLPPGFLASRGTCG